MIFFSDDVYLYSFYLLVGVYCWLSSLWKCRVLVQQVGLSLSSISIVENTFTVSIFGSIGSKTPHSRQIQATVSVKRSSYHLIERNFTLWAKTCTLSLQSIRFISFSLVTLWEYQRTWKVHCVFHSGTFERFNLLSSNMISMQRHQRYSTHWSVYGHCFGAT